MCRREARKQSMSDGLELLLMDDPLESVCRSRPNWSTCRVVGSTPLSPFVALFKKNRKVLQADRLLFSGYAKVSAIYTMTSFS
jgi:hypothetical protein